MKKCKLPGRLQLVLMLGALSLASLPAQAVDVGVTAGVGTLGAGASLTLGITERFNARLGFGSFSQDVEFEESEVGYEGEVSVGGVFGIADFHPTGGIFRLSAGLVLNNNELNGDATITDDIDIGDGTYTVDSLSATADFDDVAPYIGIGWGNAASGRRGFTFSFDLGVMFQGGVNVDLDAQGGDAESNPGFADDLEREAERLAEDLSESINVDAYPIAALGFGYAF